MPGPFDLGANSAREIAPVQLQGGGPVVASNKDDVLQTIKTAGEGFNQFTKINNQRQEKEAIRTVQQEVKSVRDALQISKHPNLAQSYFSKEALQDPYIASVYKNFNSIQSAVQQGRLTSEYGLERMEAVMNAAISKRPQFAESIREAANTAAGANISAKVMSDILSVNPQEEAMRKLQAEAYRVGMDVDTYRGYLNREMQRNDKMAAIRLSKESGSMDMAQFGNYINMGVGGITKNIQADMLEQISQGGIVDVQRYQASAQALFTQLRTEVYQLAPEGADAAAISQQIAILDKEEQRVLKQIEDGTMQTALQQKGNLFNELAKENLRDNAPDEMALIGVFGQQTGLEAINMFAKYKTNPAAFQAMYQLDQGGILTLSSVLEQNYRAGQIIKGEAEAANPKEKRLAAYFAAYKLRTDVGNPQQGKEVPPGEVKRLVEVVKEAGKEYAVLGLSDAKVAASVAKYKETHAEVINFYNDEVSALQLEFQKLKAKGYSDNVLQLINGQIVIDPKVQQREVLGGAPTWNTWSTWLRQANQTLKMGQVYKANGVFPATVFTGADGFFVDVRSGTQSVPVDNGGQVNVTFNPDGSFTWE